LKKRGDAEADPDRQGPLLRAQGRPWRDRALIFLLLSTGLRREEVVRLNLDPVEPDAPDDLRHTFAFQFAQVMGADAYEL
jgi:hypothetical protein